MFTLQAGITNPLDYPIIIDKKIEGRTLATKVKWQQKWKSASVNGVHVGEDFIEDLKARIKQSQVISNVVPA
jgi:hypothetical protein